MRRFIIVLCLLASLGVIASTAVAQEVAQAQTTYTVVPGDNLFRLSLRFNTTIQAIAAANGITNVNLIYVGQTLTIPTGGGAPPPPGPRLPLSSRWHRKGDRAPALPPSKPC